MMTSHFFPALTRQSGWHRAAPALGAPRWLAARRTWRVARRQDRHLEELPEHLLRDVGLSRSDIARMRRELPFD